MHQYQAGLHGVEVHLDAAFGFGANAAVGHHQGFAVRHPRYLMRADAMGRDLPAVNQAFAFKAVNPQQPAARIGRVVFSGVEPFAVLVNHGMAIKVTIGQRREGLQQRPVLEADEVAFGAWAAGDEQRNGLGRVVDDVVAALFDLGIEHLGAVERVADGEVIAVDVVTGTEQQRALALLFEQRPAAQRDGAEQ